MNLTVLQDGSEKIQYNTPSLPLYVRRGDLYGLSNKAALCHWHDDVELLLCTEGYLDYNVNGKQIHVCEGNAIFVNSRQMHYGYSTDGSDCHYCCYTFRPQELFCMGDIADKFVLPLLTSCQLSYLILDSKDLQHHELLNILKQIDKLYCEMPDGFELLALSAIFEFWQQLYFLVKDHLEESIAVDSNTFVVKQMLAFIRTHYQDKLTLEMIACSGGVCRTRCCQFFKQYLGQTPNNYLNSFRLEKSMQMLSGTKLSVTEIAASCGFGSSSYFTEMFTREKGFTPTQYRKNLP